MRLTSGDCLSSLLLVQQSCSLHMLRCSVLLMNVEMGTSSYPPLGHEIWMPSRIYIIPCLLHKGLVLLKLNSPNLKSLHPANLVPSQASGCLC